jgi:Zn-dependent M16 (insulinase) family peptidase
VYANTSSFIRDFVAGDEEIDKYIISSIAATEALMSTAREGFLADAHYLAGLTYEEKLRTRTQMLNLKKDELLGLCDMFDAIREKGSVCVVGNENALADTGDEWTVYRL